MHWIWVILIGFVVGLIARALMPGKDALGFFMTAALGIGGSLAATFLGQMLHFYKEGESAGFIGAIVGAIVLLFVYNLITRKS